MVKYHFEEFHDAQESPDWARMCRLFLVIFRKINVIVIWVMPGKHSLESLWEANKTQNCGRAKQRPFELSLRAANRRPVILWNVRKNALVVSLSSQQWRLPAQHLKKMIIMRIVSRTENRNQSWRWFVPVWLTNWDQKCTRNAFYYWVFSKLECSWCSWIVSWARFERNRLHSCREQKCLVDSDLKNIFNFHYKSYFLESGSSESKFAAIFLSESYFPGPIDGRRPASYNRHQ